MVKNALNPQNLLSTDRNPMITNFNVVMESRA